MPEFTLESAIKFICDPKSVQQVNNTVSGLKSMIGKALGAIGIGFSLKAMNEAVEQVRSVNMALESAVGQFGDIDEIQKKILDTSKDVVGNYEDVAKNVSDLVKNNKTLFDVDKATRFTDIMTKLTKMSGGSNADATGLVSSMANAMKNGKFDSGSLEALFAKAPQAIKILTDYYGVSERKLRMMAQAGILKAKDIQKAFMNAGEAVDKSFEQMSPKVTDVLSSARSQLKFFIEETDEMFGITKMVAKFLQSGFQTLMGWLQKARSGIMFLSEKLGGMENTLKLLAVVATSFAIAMNFDKIASGAKNIIGIFGKLGIKGTLIVAAIALIILAIDDFIHFMKGNNSLLGVMFEKAGIDSDEARKKIIAAWEAVKKFLLGAWEVIKKVGTTVWGVLTEFWEKNGARIVQVIGKFANAISTIVKAFVGRIVDWWNAMGGPIMDVVSKVWGFVKNTFQYYLDIIMDLIAIVCDIISGDWEGLWDDVKAYFVHAWENTVNWFKSAAKLFASIVEFIGAAFAYSFSWAGKFWEKTKEYFSGFGKATADFFVGIWDAIVKWCTMAAQKTADFFKGIWDAIVQFFAGIGNAIADFFSGLWSSIKETVGGIKDTIVEKFQEAVDWIKALPEKALEWGSDIINKIIEGILGVGSSLKETVEGIFEDPIGFIKGIPEKAVEWGKDIAGGLKSGIEKGAGAVRNAASWVAGKVSGVLHFSEPDEGPLSNFHTYMPDMIKMMVKGIEDGVPAVQKVMNTLTEAMSSDFASGLDRLAALADSRFVFQKTAGAVTNSNNISRNVVQNVEISNTFNGDRAGQQQASAAMRSAAQDSTAQMGRALQYAR